jgi:hypothetical protein
MITGSVNALGEARIALKLRGTAGLSARRFGKGWPVGADE